MADILPECLIQKILSFLSFNEVAKMSILSKTWLQAWSTLPNLQFFFMCWEGDTKIVDTIMERYRKGKIPIEKFEIVEFCDDTHIVFPLIDKWIDIALQYGVKDLSLDYRSYPVHILTILAAKSLRELVLQDVTLMPVSLSNGVMNCNSLRKLSLSLVRLEENMVQILLNRCPLIVSFILENCSGKLRKIKSDSVMVLKIHHYCGILEIDAMNLVSLDYMGNQIPQLKLQESQANWSTQKSFFYASTS